MNRYSYLSLFFIVVALSLFSSHVVYKEFKSSQYKAAVKYLSSQTSHNAQAISEWLISRRNEMQFIASSKSAQNVDKMSLSHLLLNFADLNGDYDTLFFIDLEGRGVVGVDHKDGSTRVMTESEAKSFFVQDREWFKRVSKGKDTFSDPLVSRATGKRVSIVAVPVYREDKFVGIIRGAVLLSSLINKVSNIQKTENSEVFLVDQRGFFVTPSKAMLNGMLRSSSDAMEAVKQKKKSWVGTYQNDLGEKVIGSVVYLPLLNWGLVYEANKDYALNDVYETFKDILILGFICLLFVIMIFSVFYPQSQDLEKARAAPPKGRRDLMSKTDLLEHERISQHAGDEALWKLVENMSQTIGQLEQTVSVLEDVGSRVNLRAHELEQSSKSGSPYSPQKLSSMLKDLRFVDAKIKITYRETKGLIDEQSWLIEQLKKSFNKP